MEVLPQMEFHPIADQYDYNHSPLWNITQGFVITDLTGLYCPSRRGMVETPEQAYMLMTVQGPEESAHPISDLNLAVGGTDYGAAQGAGDCFANNSKWGARIEKRCVGYSMKAASPMTPLQRGRGSTLGKVTDGASQTFLIGELQRVWMAVDGPFGPAGGAGGFQAGRSNDGWLFGGSGVTFDTQVSARVTGMGELFPQNGAMNDLFWEHPGSEHLDGAQFAFTDGSVTFISDEIDPLNMKAQTTMAGGELFPGDIVRQLEMLFNPPTPAPKGGRD